MKPPKPRIHARGFSLLEVLVAFSIMAMSLGALYQANARSVRAMGEAERLSRAMLTAQSLRSSLPAIPQGGLAQQGHTADGFDWRIHAQPYPTGFPEGSGAWPLYRVEIEVTEPTSTPPRRWVLISLLPERPP
jgi:general secretion pathway protein I